MKYRISLGVLIVAAVTAIVIVSLPGAQANQSAKAIDFNRDIRPILSDNCFACHGPDEKQRMARLRFDTREGAIAKPELIVPGDAARSKLIERVTAQYPDLRMPPVDSGHKLTDAQITLLRRWIDEGAKWETH